MNTIYLEEIEQDIQRAFHLQKQYAPTVAKTTAKERIAKLKSMLAWIKTNEHRIKEAMYQDFRKHPSEVMIGEVMGVMGELKHYIKSLEDWMKPDKLPTPLNMIGSSAYLHYEPKGVCLIMAPWNYPFNLCVKPMVQAIGAGNTVILKPSEMTNHTARLVKEMCAELFEEQEVAVFEGDASVAELCLSLPFNHIFFTGSPAIGKVVMAAAAKHLASVTLELGGKSPCIIDETANIKKTADQVAWGKFLNNGQTCIAPDYALVHENVYDTFLEELKKATEKMYNSDGQGVEKSESYCRIVNARHFGRISRILMDAVEKGANIAYGGQTNEADNFIAPTVVTDVTDQMRIMQEEIFGPVLPVLKYSNTEQVLATINSREKPLALYIHSANNKNINHILQSTSAGDTVINDSIIHYGHTEMPFGGVNNSGIGKSGGVFGFKEFSNTRGVLKQHFGDLSMIYPPYTKQTQKIVNFLVKYL